MPETEHDMTADPSLSVIEFTGHDACQFLQNQLSADVTKIQPAAAGFACCCNPAGRVLALMMICPVEERFFAVLAADLAGDIQAWLQRFVFRDKVEIALRDDLSVVHGAATAAVSVHTNPESGLIYSVVEVAALAKSSEGNLSAFKKNEFEAGIIWLNRDTSAQFLPQMLGYEAIGALSFRKGCYPGQEIIARTRYLGKLKRRPLRAMMAGRDLPGIMAKVKLEKGDEGHSAVLVDVFSVAPDQHYLFMVARADEAFVPDKLRWDEKQAVLS